MNQVNKRVLYLPIKKEWYDLILKGIKKEEYRDITPFYDARLSKDYDAVLFQNGYNPDSPRMLVEFLGVEKKRANPAWSGGFTGICYAIKLGSILNDNYKT